MKRIVKRYYDDVKMPPQKKQAMLTGILENKHTARKVRPSTWKVAAAVGVAAAIVLAVVLPLTLGNKSAGGTGAANDQIAMQATSLPTAAQAIPAAETKNYVSAIVLSLNPDVEIRLDEEGVVTEVVGLNEDGVTLVEGIEFAGLSLENATIMVVNQLILQEYITAAQIQNEINISLESDSITLDTLSVMTDIIKTAADGHNIAVDVIADEDAGALQIVLEGQGSPDILPDPEPPEDDTDAPPEDGADTPPEEDKTIGLEMEFIMSDRNYSAYVDNVLIHTKDGQTIDYLLDFVDSTLGKTALTGIIELLEKGYITDEDADSVTRFSFTGDCSSSDINGVASMAELLIAEYDLKLTVLTDAEAKQILLKYDETISHETQESTLTIKDALNHMVNKDEEDLSPRQIAILKAAFTYREYERLLEKRYYVVVPDLIGMSEQQAVDMLLQLGLVPGIVREKRPGYDPTQEGGFAPVDDPVVITEEEYPEGVDSIREDWPAEPEETPQWDYPVVEFGCVFYMDAHPGGMCQTGGPLQINVIMPQDYDGPESISDYKPKSGIILMDMDVPFDVSAYPDTFLLSEAHGFDAMTDYMNDLYTIRDEAAYIVVIDRDTGWEDTAMITITHRDGFPQYKFFVQGSRIIEVETQWRRDVPTAEEEAWAERHD